MKKVTIVSIIAVLCLALLGAVGSSFGKEQIVRLLSEKPKYTDSKYLTRITTWEKEMPPELPKLQGSSSFENAIKGLICEGIDIFELKSYEKDLIKSGFGMISQSDSNPGIYLKGNIRVIILNIPNSIIIKCQKVKTDKDLKAGELTAAEAKNKIQGYISAIKDNSNYMFGLQVEYVEHIDIPGAWDKMRLQAFRTTFGDFIIENGSVSKIELFSDAVVADIDRDEQFELIYMYSTGGRGASDTLDYAENIVASRNGEVIASVCWKPFLYYDRISFEKIDDTTVKLRRYEYYQGDKTLTADYGRLKIVKSKGKNIIRPEKIMRFPYEELDRRFDNGQIFMSK